MQRSARLPQELGPGRLGLGWASRQTQNLSPAVHVHRHGDDYSAAIDPSAFTHLHLHRIVLGSCAFRGLSEVSVQGRIRGPGARRSLRCLRHLGLEHPPLPYRSTLAFPGGLRRFWPREAHVRSRQPDRAAMTCKERPAARRHGCRISVLSFCVAVIGLGLAPGASLGQDWFMHPYGELRAYHGDWLAVCKDGETGLAGPSRSSLCRARPASARPACRSSRTHPGGWTWSSSTTC